MDAGSLAGAVFFGIGTIALHWRYRMWVVARPEPALAPDEWKSSQEWYVRLVRCMWPGMALGWLCTFMAVLIALAPESNLVTDAVIAGAIGMLLVGPLVWSTALLGQPSFLIPARVRESVQRMRETERALRASESCSRSSSARAFQSVSHPSRSPRACGSRCRCRMAATWSASSRALRRRACSRCTCSGPPASRFRPSTT